MIFNLGSIITSMLIKDDPVKFLKLEKSFKLSLRSNQKCMCSEKEHGLDIQLLGRVMM